MARLAALLLYPLALLARALNALRGRDPLRLRRPPPGSLWIPRGEPGRMSYFSEASDVEGRGHGGHGWIAGRTLLALAPAFARRRVKGPRPAPDGEIPDEIYTLW